jgi:outer membrane protein insertion porin family
MPSIRSSLLLSFFVFSWWFASGLPSPASANPLEKGPEASSAQPPLVSEIVVEILDFIGNESVWVDMARHLIFLQEGNRFSPDKLEASIEALKLSGRFQKIHVDSKERDGMSILFQLTPFRLIKKMKISGHFPLFKKEVLDAMTVYAGDPIDEEIAAKQESLISELFHKEGYPEPRVHLAAVEDPKDGHYVLKVNIEKGPYLSLEQLNMTGNRAFSTSKLKRKMSTWRASLFPGFGGRFREDSLKEDVRNLTEYYWKERFPEATMEYSLEKNPEKETVRVLVDIQEGRLYETEFEGNEAFGDRVLRRDLVLYQQGVKKDRRFRRSLKKIQERYRTAGYLEADVKVEEQEAAGQDELVRKVRFVIDEGPCTVVEAVEITGNEAFDEDKIRKQMFTGPPGLTDKGAYVPEVLDDDLDNIESLYLKHGYMNTVARKVLDWSDDKTRVKVRVEIEEGVRTEVASVAVEGITAVSEEQAREAIRLKAGEPFRKYMVRSDENALSALIGEKGYPHVKVTGDISIAEDGSTTALVYRVDEGPSATVGDIYFRGNFRTKESVLLNELGMKTGEPFSLKEMLKGQRGLRNMGLFKSVKVKALGLKEKRESVDLFVEVEEKRPYYWEVGGGYDSERGAFGTTKVGDSNLFGTNKDAWLGGEFSQIGYRAEARVREPRLFGSQVSATVGAFTEKREEFNQTFGTRTDGVSLAFYRKWTRALGTGLTFRFEGRDQFRRRDVSGDDFLEDDSDQYRPRRILVVTPSVLYDTRDSITRPRKGTFSQLSLDASRGLSEELDNFFKYRLDLRYYYTPIDRLTFAWLGRVGYIDPINSSGNVPDDQLFFLGGTSSVRGFEENLLRFDEKGDPVGGREALNGSVEARVDLGGNFELALFYDIGAVRKTINKAGSDEFRDSAGLGLRYITPIGPVGALYGWKLNRKEGESPGQFHFSVGYTF